MLLRSKGALLAPDILILDIIPYRQIPRQFSHVDCEDRERRRSGVGINGSDYSHLISYVSIAQKYENVVRPKFPHGPSGLNLPDAGYAKIGAAVFAFAP
jgi:hypothetical protein